MSNKLSKRKCTDWRTEFSRLEGAYSPATMRSYRADVEAFENWCHANGICAPFPATAAIVCQFLEDQGEDKAASTVQRRLYAIRKVHRLLKLPDPTYDEDIHLTFRKVKRSRPVRPKQAKGLTREYLDLFLDSEPDTLRGLENERCSRLAMNCSPGARKSLPCVIATSPSKRMER